MTLKFNEETGELLNEKPLPIKVINKGYVLIEDLKMLKHDAINIVKKMCDEGLNKKLSQKEWGKQLDKRCKYVVAKKGTVFFKSKIFKNEKGEPYLFTNSTNKEVIEPHDILFGNKDPLIIENDILELWRIFLRQKEFVFSLGKYKEIESREFTFEQTELVKSILEIKRRAEQKVHNTLSYIEGINKLISKIMN